MEHNAYEPGFNDSKTLKKDFSAVFLQPTKSKTKSFTLSLVTQYIILKLPIMFPDVSIWLFALCILLTHNSSDNDDDSKSNNR